jgi:hypothetical protein
LILTGALLSPGYAQENAAPQRSEQFQQRLQQFKERLHLRPEQIEQVRPILVEEAQKMKEVRDRHAGEQNRRARLGMARELKGIQGSADDKLKKVLDKEQMKELKKMREEAREKFRAQKGR